jgi:hypothetical protein
MTKKLKRVDKSDPAYNDICSKIRAEFASERYERERKLKIDGIWTFTDEYRDYFSNHDPSDIDDVKTRSIWEVITMNPIICGVEPYLADLIKDVDIFYIEDVDKFTADDYWSHIKAFRDRFYAEYPDYQNTTCTEEQYDKWKVVYVYMETLLSILRFKMSPRNVSDMVECDIAIGKTIRQAIRPFVPYSNVMTVKINYSSMNMESVDGSSSIRLCANKITDANYDIVGMYLIKLFRPADIVANCLSGFTVNADNIQCGARLLSDLDYADKESDIVTNIEKAQHSDTYWRFYATLVYKHIIGSNVEASESLKHALSLATNGDDFAACLLGFAKCRNENMEMFDKMKGDMDTLCAEKIKTLKGPSKYALMDVQDAINGV